MTAIIQPHVFVTAQQHIQQEQQRNHPHASGDFSWLLSGLTLATKVIAAQIRRAGLVDVVAERGPPTFRAKTVQKLDVLANQALLACLGNRGNVGVLASEENDEPAVVLRDPQYGKYVVIFDPLDGSSNIDVNVSVGTIFSIFRRDPPARAAPRSAHRPIRYPIRRPTCCSPARNRLPPAMSLYGPSTLLVYSTGHGVHGFTLDPSFGAYMRHASQYQNARNGPLLFGQRGQLGQLPGRLSKVRRPPSATGGDGRTYSSRYVGSLVADFHRTLVKGGVFCYPPTAGTPKENCADV